MADDQVYVAPGTAYTITQAIPLSASTNTVLIDIYNVTDGTVTQAATAMTFVNGVVWKFSFTPAASKLYAVTIENQTLDVQNYKYLNTVAAPSASAGSTGGSSLTTLRTDFLISIDHYNANDLTGTASAGDRAVRVINKALQKIYSDIIDSNLMEATPSTIASVSGTDFVTLTGISDLRYIMNVTESVNDVKLIAIPFWKYRQLAPDPSASVGNPTHYARLFNRIYFFPRPSSAITYTFDYVKNLANLSGDSDEAGIPAAFDYWITAEAHVLWQKMMDPGDTAAMSSIVAIAQDCRSRAMRDIFSNFDEAAVSESHWSKIDDGFGASFDSPVDGT